MLLRSASGPHLHGRLSSNVRRHRNIRHFLESVPMTLTDWKELASIVGTLVAVPGVLFAAYKTWREVQRINEQRDQEERKRAWEAEQSRIQRQAELEQRQKEHQLRRTEFTLAQHRRLFDDADLRMVLRYIDGDQSQLAEKEIIQAKRKFLTFFEELVLLRNSGYVSQPVALYMFGYYAYAAHNGPNFRVGIGYHREHWGLFMSFAEEAAEFLAKKEPPDSHKLAL